MSSGVPSMSSGSMFLSEPTTVPTWPTSAQPVPIPPYNFTRASLEVEKTSKFPLEREPFLQIPTAVPTALVTVTAVSNTSSLLTFSEANSSRSILTACQEQKVPYFSFESEKGIQSQQESEAGNNGSRLVVAETTDVESSIQSSKFHEQPLNSPDKLSPYPQHSNHLSENQSALFHPQAQRELSSQFFKSQLRAINSSQPFHHQSPETCSNQQSSPLSFNQSRLRSVFKPLSQKSGATSAVQQPSMCQTRLVLSDQSVTSDTSFQCEFSSTEKDHSNRNPNSYGDSQSAKSPSRETVAMKEGLKESSNISGDDETDAMLAVYISKLKRQCLTTPV